MIPRLEHSRAYNARIIAFAFDPNIPPRLDYIILKPQTGSDAHPPTFSSVLGFPPGHHRIPTRP